MLRTNKFLQKAVKNCVTKQSLNRIKKSHQLRIYRMDAKFQEIILGEMVCEKLKIIYHSDISWVQAVNLVAAKFSSLKTISRTFYVGMSEVEMLNTISKYSNGDIMDAFESRE
jgi:hypothetical protein